MSATGPYPATASASDGSPARRRDMRTFVHHDKTGTIHSLVCVEGPPGVEAMLEPEPGIVVTEIDGAELELRSEDIRSVQEYLTTHAVEASPQASPVKLVDTE